MAKPELFRDLEVSPIEKRNYPFYDLTAAPISNAQSPLLPHLFKDMYE